MSRLSVMGLAEVLGRMPEVMRMRGALERRFAAQPPDVYIGVDAPDFNLALERRLRARGIPTVHYASPSVWAWRRYRLPKIRRSVDLMLVLLPFEQAFYQEHGIEARFVGHPLAQQVAWSDDPGPARRRLGLPLQGQVVALLPGSRMSEVSRLAEPMVGTARWLLRRRPGMRFVVPLTDPEIAGRFRQAMDPVRDRAAFTLLDGDAHCAMEASDVVLLASGTATLEALLMGRPMVITYRTHPATWSIGRRMLHVPFVGLPNVLAGRAVAPELLQELATPQRLGAEVLGLLEHAGARRRQRERYRQIAGTLGEDASERAADAVCELLEARV
jgi:lipid-A-disaccharide synthase